ncbi:MAG: decarboxylating 6-phosphogluconate dehydrogenase [Bacteroidetes bacterium]|jgi:6-phosphogluconate dehydrogenase|nr:MAG: decarboxylating 6-phosphogluconate dehydrogenase [Bacteroidota bacterium]
MKIGFIGLGKMGANMVRRLLRNGHEVVAFNRSRGPLEEVMKEGAIGADSVEDLISRLDGRKVVWLMLPAGNIVDEHIAQIIPLLSKGDIIVEGGNSYWRDSVVRSEKVAAHGLHFIDCGVSGGVWGLQNGYALMYGGDADAAAFIEPVTKSLAPENGYLYCGASGAGHMVKMVHNGIEYGMMQAYAEGFEILQKSPYGMNLEAIAEMWMHGSVVRSWLLELAVIALGQDPKLDAIKGYVNDSGEGRWTVQTAIDFDVPAHVITASLFTRFESRQDESFAMKMLAALRNQFGGHAVVKAE